MTRVVLDYELKRDYQQFLNRRDRSAGRHDRAAIVRRLRRRGRCRLSMATSSSRTSGSRYETADGRGETRDVEVVTEHYSRSPAGRQGAGRLRPLSARASVAVWPRGQQLARWHPRRSAHLGVAAMTFDERVRGRAGARVFTLARRAS